MAEEVHSPYKSGDVAPEQEEILMETMLTDQVGIDPHLIGPVLDLAAVGIVNSVWRNGPVEDWHAGLGGLGDGDMLRLNSHATWRVRQLLRGWCAETGLGADASADELNTVGGDTVWVLAARIRGWATRPGRPLLTGATLAELAGEDLEDFAEHADAVLSGFAGTAEERGARFAFWRAALHAGLACNHWWGTPAWPGIVTRFMQVIDNPHHQHWGESGQLHARLAPEPATVHDRDLLQRTLLDRPWDLDAESADWIVSAGIGFLRPSLSDPSV